MATETSVDTYSGIEGVVTYGGPAFAYVSCDLEFSRDSANVPRGGKWSDIVLPGKMKFKGKIKYGLVDPDLFINAFDDGTNTTTTSEETLHAAITGTSALLMTSTAITPPSAPMTIKLKLISTDGFSAGGITITGTDSNNDEISETIEFPLTATGSTTTYYYGHQKFKTVVAIIMPAVLGANDTVTVYGAGRRSVTLGKPKYVTIVVKAYKSATSYTQITMTNCWLSKLPLSVSDATTPILPEQEFQIRDLDADVTIADYNA